MIDRRTQKEKEGISVTFVVARSSLLRKARGKSMDFDSVVQNTKVSKSILLPRAFLTFYHILAAPRPQRCRRSLSGFCSLAIKMLHNTIKFDFHTFSLYKHNTLFFQKITLYIKYNRYISK